jgi:hypothetical protein
VLEIKNDKLIQSQVFEYEIGFLLCILTLILPDTKGSLFSSDSYDLPKISTFSEPINGLCEVKDDCEIVFSHQIVIFSQSFSEVSTLRFASRHLQIQSSPKQFWNCCYLGT